MLQEIRIFVLGLALVPLWSLAAETSDALDACALDAREEPIATATGSVGIIKNLTEDPSSIRAVAGRLLTHALGGDSKSADSVCDAACEQRAQAQIVYRVAPVTFLAAEHQRDVCRQFEAETSSHPLSFDQRKFHSVEELNDWIMEFSQGHGADGKLLYERCSSNCSPRYTFLIAEQNSGYAVKAEVLCGLARDKASDVSRVSTAMRRSCAVN